MDFSWICSIKFSVQKARTGKLRITRFAHKRMHEYQLDTAALEDVFRHGKAVKERMIIREYANFSVGIIYKFDEAEERFLILTCWKRSPW
jgi:hypothetical protein